MPLPQYLDDDWRIRRLEAAERDGYKCVNCGQSVYGKKFDVHHIIARKAGGSDELSNLATLCQKCHHSEKKQTRFGIIRS